MAQPFWKLWRTDYLKSKIERTKWFHPNRPARVGDIVLIRRISTYPSEWPLGIIDADCLGRDGIVRVADVQTATSTYNRPVVKLVPLVEGSNMYQGYKKSASTNQYCCLPPIPRICLSVLGGLKI